MNNEMVSSCAVDWCNNPRLREHSKCADHALLSCASGGGNLKKAKWTPGKYDRIIVPKHTDDKGNHWIDVYDVLKAFGVTNQANGHAIKKQLAPGKRGVKSTDQDLKEAIDSITRARELEL